MNESFDQKAFEGLLAEFLGAAPGNIEVPRALAVALCLRLKAGQHVIRHGKSGSAQGHPNRIDRHRADADKEVRSIRSSNRSIGRSGRFRPGEV
jgi:hypothetical protein